MTAEAVKNTRICRGVNCEKVISANRRFCADCQVKEDEAERLRESGAETKPISAADAETAPIPAGVTHLILFWKSQHTEMLFRASDGMCIGQYQNHTMIFGDEPNRRRSHVFMNEELARQYLRGKLAAQDLRAKSPWWRRWLGLVPAVKLEIRDGEPVIKLAEGLASMEMPQSGSMRSIGKKVN